MAPEMANSYQKALADAKEELARLPLQRELATAYFDQREAQLKKTIEGLEPLCDAANEAGNQSTMNVLDFLLTPEDAGLQQSIRAVLAGVAGTRLSPTSIRDALQARGFDTTNYSNAMATIHRALKRLDDDPNSNVKAFTNSEGKTLYGWSGPAIRVRGFSGVAPRYPAYGETITEPPPIKK